jgi:hypothetical protein
MLSARRVRSLFVAAPAIVLFAGIVASTAACSGAGDSGIASSASSSKGLPCCHQGYIYQCASDAALNRCADTAADDTTDCTKTSTTCGGASSGGASSSGSSGASSSSGGSSSGSSGASSSSSSSSSGGAAAKKKTGDKCVAESECQGDLCLVYGAGSAGFCSNACATSTDCPSKFRCELADKLGSKVCVPQGEKLIGETCSYNMDCASNLCLTVGGAALGYCTGQCNVPADCPATWTCSAVSGASGKFCKRP